MCKKDYLKKSAIAYVEGEGLEVVEVIYGIEDKLVLRDREEDKISKVKVNYGVGRDYIRYRGRRIYMENIIRL